MTDDGGQPIPTQATSLETLIAQGLGRVDERTRALVPAIHPSTTYQRDADGGYSSGRGYTRPHNPTYDEPEEMIRALEGGSECLLTSSGMAAATAVFMALFPGDHVIAPRVMYWSLRSWLADFAMSWGLEVEFVDTGDLEALAAAIRPGKTRLLWLETPCNPTWDVTDIAAAAEIAHAAGAKVAVDSTVATPVLTRPLEHGADLVVHSATKYLNGHSDVLAGAIVTATEDSYWNRVRAWRRDGGAVLGPFEAWLLQRGMRTLFVRVRRSCETALAVARHFEPHAKVDVLYPGLPSHPGHAIAARQMSGGFGGMLSIRHRDGQAGAMETAARTAVFKRATSLGGIESLIEHRASIEGPSTPVPADLLRLSVGLETVDDLIADLEAALDHNTGSNSARAGAAPPAGAKAPVATNDPIARIQALVGDQIRSLVADRGCELVFESFEDGIVRLRIVGSPGASIPIRRAIENLLKHHVPQVRAVHLGASPEANSPANSESVATRIQQVLDVQINPAVAGHGGKINLVAFRDGTAQVAFDGRCLGCAMANVTLRQGVEVLILEQVPEVVSVEDLSEHQTGTNPFFKTKKG